MDKAVAFLRKDKVVQAALGEHIFEQYADAKDQEWAEYISTVHGWELDRYLARY